MMDKTQAPPNRWKPVAIIAGVILVGALLLVLGLVFLSRQFTQQSKVIAESIYGGPLPASATALMGVDMKKGKVSVIWQPEQNLVLMTWLLPKKTPASQLQSTQQVEGVLNELNETIPLKSTLLKLEQAKPDSMTLYGQTIPTLLYADGKQRFSEAGVLNLDEAQLVFVGSANTPDHLNEHLANSFMAWPRLKKDSHFKP